MKVSPNNSIIYRRDKVVEVVAVGGGIVSVAFVVLGLMFLLPPSMPVVTLSAMAVPVLYGMWWIGLVTGFRWRATGPQRSAMEEYLRLSKGLRKEIGVKPTDILNMNNSTAGDFRLKVESLYRWEKNQKEAASNPRTADLMDRVDREIGTFKERERVMKELG